MSSSVEYRRGDLRDLSSFTFEQGLSVTGESLEFNVLGMGHEFWIAVQKGVIIALTVLVEEDPGNVRILHLEVAPSRKKAGVGTALVKAILEAHPRDWFAVVPFEGTEAFYKRLGFSQTGRWEMKREPLPSGRS